MKTELKDVIHLLVGCEVITNADISPLVVGIKGKLTLYNIAYGIGVIQINDEATQTISKLLSEFKPILRRLSSMTEEEAVNIGNLSFVKSDGSPFTSNKWKLHLHVFGNSSNHVTIVLEEKPLMHIDELWSHPPSIRRINEGFRSVPLFTHVIVHQDFKIEDHAVFSMYDYKRSRPQQFVIAYLLSKGFDLFNLIETNQAIDAETLK